MIGKKFGKLTVLSEIEGKKLFILCKCDCGNYKIARKNNIRAGHTKSCGCLYGTHRLSKTPVYQTWCSIIQRCLNKNSTIYKHYGGRGIKICDRWLKFENFYSDMGKKPNGLTIERKDNSLDYQPDNCIWTTQTEQNRNRRIFKTNKTGVTGIHFYAKTNKYIAEITKDYKKINLGSFDTVEEAAIARKAGEEKYW